MRICDLHTGAIRLGRAAKLIDEQWEATTEHWKDKNSENFQRDYLLPLTPQVKLMLSAINQLSDAIDRAQRELTDKKDAVDD